MEDQQFQQFLVDLKAYLEEPKIFVTNLDRAREFYTAVALAEQLFPEAEIKIKEDPLQTGAMILHIEAPDIIVRGVREIKDFSTMLSFANNFEIYPIGKNEVCLAAVFHGVNKRI